MEKLKTFWKDKSFVLFLPIAFILAIIPLVVRMVAVNTDDYTKSVWNSSIMYDLYSQKKAFLLIIFTVILIILSVIFFKKIFHQKDKITYSIMISITVFLIFTLLSAIFSKYSQTSFWGLYDRAEGFITIACYIILFIYSIYTFKTENNYKFIVVPIIIVVIINSFVGFFQFIGKDLLNTKLGLSMVVPSEFKSIVTGVTLLSPEGGSLYGTLYNYNYVGSFSAIILPILIGLLIFEKRSIFYRILLLFSSLLAIWLLFGSTSRSGLVGVFASIVFAIIMFGKLLLHKWKYISVIIVSIIIITLGLNFASNGTILARVPSLMSDALSFFTYNSDFDYKEHVPVKDIVQANKDVEVVFPKDSLIISLSNGNYKFTNSQGNIINYVRNVNTLTTSDSYFSNISFTLGSFSSTSNRADKLILNLNNQPLFLFRLDNYSYIHLANFSTGRNITLDHPSTFGFNGKEKLGSARGYIWSRSIPLLKDSLILGGGPDTFVYRFPQNDLIGKYYAYDTPNMIVDKPHNLYLQIGLNYGVIALLAFLAVILIYLVDSMKLYALRAEYNTPSIVYGTITCLGIIGYLFAGFFNDSVISVAPVFWIVFGVGVALNYINRNEIKTKIS